MSERAERIGRVVRRIRDEAGLTQTEMAEAIGYSHQHLSLIELGHNEPSLRMLRRIYHAATLTEFAERLIDAALEPDEETDD